MRMAARREHFASNAPEAFGQHRVVGRSRLMMRWPRAASSAWPSDTGFLPSTSEMNFAASTGASRSMPVSMPRPRSMKVTSSVATLPVAPFA